MKATSNWPSKLIKVFLLLGIFFLSLGTASLVLLFIEVHQNLALPYYLENDGQLQEVKTVASSDRVKEESGFLFEEGAYIYKNHMRSYYAFSREYHGHRGWPFDDWWQDKMFLGVLRPAQGQRGTYVIVEDFASPLPLENHCQKVYCFQHRTRLSQIPSVLWKGLIGVEDYRFLLHKGVDLRSLMRALVADIKAMKFVQGGSTLTQQLVKNVFLSNEKSIVRKVKEMIIALYLESKLSKQQIIEAYFNEVIWGALQGIRIKGIVGASLFYFNKRPLELTEYESAILVSLLKGPGYYHPIRRSKRLRKRSLVLFKKLQSLGFFSKRIHPWSTKRYQKWVNELKIRNKKKDYRLIWLAQENAKKNEQKISHYTDYVWERSILQSMKRWKKKITNEQVDLGVKILVGNPFCYSDRDCPLTFYYSKKEKNFSKAMSKEYHQVGSLLKPILFSYFLEEEKRWEDLVSTEALTLDLKSGPWEIREASKMKGKEMTVLNSLLHSRNRPLIRLASEYGFSELEDKLEDILPRLKKPLSEYPAQLLGGIEMSVEEVFELYADFIKKECEEKYAHKELWEESVLYQLSFPKKTTVRYWLGQKMQHNRFFGKTGTSNKGLDNWYVIFSGDQLFVIWVGQEGDRTDLSLPLSGSSAAFPLFKYFMGFRGQRFPEFECPSSSQAL